MVAATISNKQPWYRTCRFEPATFVPKDPKPIAHVRHFHNEAAKREYRAIEAEIRAQFEAGEITREEVLERVTRSHERLTHRVPVYRGVSAGVYRILKNEHRRRERKRGFSQVGRTIKRNLPFMKGK